MNRYQSHKDTKDCHNVGYQGDFWCSGSKPLKELTFGLCQKDLNFKKVLKTRFTTKFKDYFRQLSQENK